MYPQMKLRHYDCADWRHSLQKHLYECRAVQEVRKAAAGPAEPGVSAKIMARKRAARSRLTLSEEPQRRPSRAAPTK
jgi:hypothetical protein